MDVLESCTLCPRNCHINRYKTVSEYENSEKIKETCYNKIVE